LSLKTLAQTLAELTIMFDFEKLTVYLKAKEFNKKVNTFLSAVKLDRTANDQLRRAAFSIMLNIAEGSGRYSKRDKRNFFVVARGSVFECVAIMDYLKDIDVINHLQFNSFYSDLDELSRMLFAMIKSLS
jgi:four helix bundle protein